MIKPIETIEVEKEKPDLLNKEEAEDAQRQICIACPGYCCHVFSFPGTMESIKNRATSDCSANNRESAQFVLQNCMNLETENDAKSTYFTCDKFDWKNGMCTDYNNRPYFCRRFLCLDCRSNFKRPRKKDILIWRIENDNASENTLLWRLS